MSGSGIAAAVGQARTLGRLIVNHPANSGAELRALGRAAAWQLYKRAIGRPRDTDYAGYRFRCYPDSGEPGRLYYFNKRPDYAEMEFMRRYLRPGDHLLDGGAHEGLYTLAAAALVGPGGRVHAFEAAPRALWRLCGNIRRNSLTNVTVYGYALTDADGPVEFVIDRGTGAGNRLKTPDDAGRTIVATAGTRISTLLDGVGLTLGKLDIEGAEPLALRGAEPLLERGTPPVWQLELVEKFMRRYDVDLQSCISWLREREFDLAAYDVAANRLVFDQPMALFPNVFAVHRPSREAIAARLRC